jgi:16S rRNA (cytidine1402-2'-O)-methyltransferase
VWIGPAFSNDSLYIAAMRATPSPTSPEDVPAPSARTFAISGHLLTAPKAVPGLHLVATPIGNLGDITIRALETLAGVDIIACEDTRITRRLTERYSISGLLKQYHEHNAEQARPKILEKLAQGASIALVSDAGTPLISDPGFKLVREVSAAGFNVISLPGPSSVLAALAVAALPTDLMGSRDAAICRELTKMHEEVRRASVSELAAAADGLETRGEFVLVIGPPAADAQAMTEGDLDEMLRSSLQHDSVKDAVAHAVELSGRPRREIYARALELAKETERRIQKEGGDGED